MTNSNMYYHEYTQLRKCYILLCNSYLPEKKKLHFIELLDDLDRRIIKKKQYHNFRKKNGDYLTTGISKKEYKEDMLKWD